MSAASARAFSSASSSALSVWKPRWSTPGSAPARGDGEVDAGIVEHPFRVVALDDTRLGRKKRRVIADAGRQIGHADVHVETLHDCDSRGVASRRRPARIAAAAVFGEEADQVVHGFVAGGVDDRPSDLPAVGETGPVQFLQMEGKRRGRHIQQHGDLPGGHALRAGLDQCAEHRQTGRMREGCQRFDDLRRFHISNVVEIVEWKQCDSWNVPPCKLRKFRPIIIDHTTIDRAIE